MEKSFLKRAILLIIALVMVTAMLVSCKQKVVEPVEPEKPVVHDVYAVGYVYGGGIENKAVFFKNGDMQLLPGGYSTVANSVFVAGDDVYIVGCDQTPVEHTAMLWKNGQRQNLTLLSEWNEANSLYVSDGDVYIAGYESIGRKRVAVLWKNGTPQKLTDHAVAKSVFVSGSDIYVAGYEKNAALLWKNGVAQKLSDGSKMIQARSVFVSDNDVYVVGYKGDSWHSLSAILWKNGEPQKLKCNSENYKANAVFVADNKVYVAGDYNNGSKMVLWKDNEPQYLCDTTTIRAGLDGLFVVKK